MSSPESFGLERQPSRAVSIALSVALVAVWGTIRLYVFPTVAFPLTYVIPMLLCVWTRDRVALVGMTLAFVALHHIKLFWILPAGELNADEWWGNYVATLLNIGVGAVVIHQIIRLRDRLDAAMNNVRDQAEELRMQTEELAQQNEELAVQTEELSQQTEELRQKARSLRARTRSCSRRPMKSGP
jgi:FtsZ-binding cell division protein ZapB